MSTPGAAAVARSRRCRRGRLTVAGLLRGSLAARCSRRISLRLGWLAALQLARPCQSAAEISAGRRATTRLAARQVRRRHRITVIRATGAPQNRSTMDRRECGRVEQIRPVALNVPVLQQVQADAVQADAVQADAVQADAVQAGAVPVEAQAGFEIADHYH